jgi:hypothetical protein
MDLADAPWVVSGVSQPVSAITAIARPRDYLQLRCGAGA